MEYRPANGGAGDTAGDTKFLESGLLQKDARDTELLISADEWLSLYRQVWHAFYTPEHNIRLYRDGHAPVRGRSGRQLGAECAA